MEEIRYFGRLSVFALIIGGIYWFLSHDPAGAVMLIGFGVATGAGFTVLRAATRQSPQADETADSTRPDGPFGDESGPLPTRSAAPLAVGLGVAVIGMAGAFGPWFVLAGAVPLLLGAVDWLRAANRELTLREDLDQDEPADEAASPAARAADQQALPGAG